MIAHALNSLPQLSRENVAFETARTLEFELASKDPENSTSASPAQSGMAEADAQFTYT
jgi:hypothetical protein